VLVGRRTTTGRLPEDNMTRTTGPAAFHPAQTLTGFLFALAVTSCALASSEEPDRLASVGGSTDVLYGEWTGGDTASDAIYGTMKISTSSITWKGNNRDPRCTVNYRRLPEGYGVRFRDQTDNPYLTAPGDHRFKTYLLKIKGGKCALGLTHFRLTLDDELGGYLDMVEYKGPTNPIGRMHFHHKQSID